MLVPMTPVQILARRTRLPAVIATMHRLGAVELTGTASEELGLAPAGPGPGDAQRIAELRTDAADLVALLDVGEMAAAAVAGQDWLRPVTVVVPPDRLDRLGPGLGPLLGQIASRQAEYETVRRYHDALTVLLPVEPELALLSDRDLTRLGLATVVLVLDTPHAEILDTFRDALRAAVGDRFHLAGALTGEQTVGCVLVAPHASLAGLRTLLAREHIRHVPLPSGYEQMSLAHAVTEFGHRMAALPGELAGAWRSLARRTAELAPGWRQRRSAALDMYSDLASLFERAGRIEGSGGSITQLAVLSMPDDDISHPIPDLTGYITEGQIVLSRELNRRGIFPPIDVLPSLSRLMNAGIGAGSTREDHRDLADQLYACYARGRQVRDLAAIVGTAALGQDDRRYLAFADDFEQRFINQGTQRRSIDATLDLAWDLLGRFPRHELRRIRPHLLDRRHRPAAEAPDRPADHQGPGQKRPGRARDPAITPHVTG